MAEINLKQQLSQLKKEKNELSKKIVDSDLYHQRNEVIRKMKDIIDKLTLEEVEKQQQQQEIIDNNTVNEIVCTFVNHNTPKKKEPKLILNRKK